MNNSTIQELMLQSGVNFGTSGARGLVEQITDAIAYSYTTAFIQHLKNSEQLYAADSIAIAGDLRSSTNQIMNACAKAVIDCNLQIINCGYLASPAIALYGIKNKIPTIMVTGSHIPDDRNGIKFNTPKGEILKSDEQAIRQLSISLPSGLFKSHGEFNHTFNYLPAVNLQAQQDYRNRFLNFFHKNCLESLKVGVYQHSGVARDIIVDILNQLGAQTMILNRSEQFVPVDTEAIREEDIRLAKQWSEQYALDAIVSTDGDADRPLIADERGNWFRGDIVGILCAQYLGIKHIVTPVSSNTCVELCQSFDTVIRTKIGSPYVIEAMNTALTEGKQGIAGYEANGGFLTADASVRGKQILDALPTRDAIIVMLTLLHQSKLQNCALSKLSDTLPKRFTYSDRIKEIPTEQSQKLLQLYADDDSNQQFIKDFKDIVEHDHIQINEKDMTDGLRIILNNQNIIHFRPSGNAPEFRCYTEANNIDEARQLNHQCLNIIASLLK